MKDLCIPIPHFAEDQIAEVELKIAGKKMSFYFRVESFPWSLDDNEPITDDGDSSLAKISRLKKAIAEYDKNWELIQIYTPSEKSRFIQVLYRKKQSANV